MQTENSSPQSADTPYFFWNDSFLLGFSPMDQTHEEFVKVVQAMLQASPNCLQDTVQQFIVHAQQHFGEEDAWMRATEFPAAECHIEEHAQVLKSAYEVLERAKAGDLVTTQRFAQELTRWFPGHADYLDSALAAWMVKRQHGGKPVVLRRQIGQTSASE